MSGTPRTPPPRHSSDTAPPSPRPRRVFFLYTCRSPRPIFRAARRRPATPDSIYNRRTPAHRHAFCLRRSSSRMSAQPPPAPSVLHQEKPPASPPRQRRPDTPACPFPVCRPLSAGLSAPARTGAAALSPVQHFPRAVQSPPVRSPRRALPQPTAQQRSPARYMTAKSFASSCPPHLPLDGMAE